jgi:hypothetical protein
MPDIDSVVLEVPDEIRTATTRPGDQGEEP